MTIQPIQGGVARGAAFFDREQLLAELRKRLQYENIQLAAARRTGKTSIMQRLLTIPPSGAQMTYIDCQHFDNPTELLDSIANELNINDPIEKVKQWLTTIKRAGVGLTDGFHLEFQDARQPRMPNPAEIIQELQKRRTKYVLALDEFSMMLENMTNSRFDHATIRALLQWLRALRISPSSATALNFLFGGSTSLDYWLRQFNTPNAFNDVSVVMV